MRRWWKWVAALVVVAVALWFAFGRGGEPARYRTALVERGDITTAIAASGKLQALRTVEVGSQVSGQIVALYADYNTQVRRGQVLARIDPGTFAARATQSQAQAAGARAEVSRASAQVAEARARLLEAERNYASKQALAGRGFYPARSLETDEATVSAARAALDAARAQAAVSQAGVAQSSATVRQNQLDVTRAVIRSPIDGVVIDRPINLGQTVAASLQAPKLFTIAEDLSRMQVEAAVDEADIGRVAVGQRVRFTVDAFPDDTFAGSVAQVRIAGVETSNVVTYTVIIDAPNPARKLLPGMTANAEIILGELRQVLKAPAAALRWRPPGDAEPPRPPQGPGGFNAGVGGPGMGGGGRGNRERLSPDRTVARLDRELDLTSAQEREIRIIVERQFQAMGAAGDRNERRRRREAMRGKIARVLTPEQAAIYAASAPEAGAGRAGRGTPGLIYVVGDDGTPQPRPVRTVEGDGDKVAVVGGALKPGDQVIIGEETPVIEP